MTARELGAERPGGGATPVQGPRQGVRLDALDEAARERALADAFDYRGDVTLRLDDGSSIEGYVFAVEPSAAQPHVKIFPADAKASRLAVPLGRIVGIEFSGRDTADGRSWEAWVRRWEERRRARAEGRDLADIEPKPEPLD